MSHEIQTPMTLILIPLKNGWTGLRKKRQCSLQQRLRLNIPIIANRYFKDRFELHHYADKGTGRSWHWEPTEIILVQGFKGIFQFFEEQAGFKGISFKMQLSQRRAWKFGTYDKDKNGTYFFKNLLSNAFKIHPKGGAITLM